MTKNPLPDFVAGSDKQHAWANTLRFKFLHLVIDEFPRDDLIMLYSVRVFPTWWIDNRKELSVANAPKFIRAVKSAVTRAGSIEAAVDAQLISAEKKKMKAEARTKELEEQEQADIDYRLLEEIESERGERPW